MSEIILDLPYNYIPRSYQIPLWKFTDNGGKRALCIDHRRAGKDKTCFNITIKRSQERVGLYYYILPTYAQGKKVIWNGVDKDGFRTLNHIPKELIIGKPNETEMLIKLINGSMIQIVGSDQYDSLRGPNPIGCVLSEYSRQNPAIWNDILRPILAENDGWAIFISTPYGRNHFYDLAQMAKDNKDWFYELLTVDDTHAISQEIIDEERKTGMPEEKIQQEYYVSFNASIEQQLITADMIEEAINRKYTDEMLVGLPRVMGVDFGRGGAQSVIVIRHGLKVLPDIFSTSSKDTTLITSKICEYDDKYRPDAIFADEIGMGGPIIDRLRQLGRRVIGVTAGARAVENKKYYNRRSEMWWNTRVWLINGGCIPNNEKLKAALSAVLYGYTGIDQMYVERKEDTLDRLPQVLLDMGDAVIHTFALPVVCQIPSSYEDYPDSHYIDRRKLITTQTGY